MEKLILLRQGTRRLNDHEFKSLLTNIGRDKVTTLLFKQLLHQFNTNQSEEDIDEIQSNISQIIHQRKDEMNASTDGIEEKSSPISIEDLPNEMLSEISTFLRFDELLNFEKVSRALFIGSRSSSQPIHSMDRDAFTKLIQYRAKHKEERHRQLRIKSLSVDCDDLCRQDYDSDDEDAWDPEAPWLLRYESVSLDFMNRVQSLEFWITYDQTLSLVLNAYILNQSDTFPNIKTLRLLPYPGFELGYIDPSLRDLICCCSGLEYFRMDREGRDELDGNDAFSDYEWARNLKGVAFDEQNTVSVKVYSALTEKLESLHLPTLSMMNDMKCKLINLKELCLQRWAKPYGFNDEAVHKPEYRRSLLQTEMPNLRRLHFGNTSWTRKIMELDDMILWLQRLLKTVEYMSFSFGDEHVPHFMNALLRMVSGSNVTGRPLELRLNYMDKQKWSDTYRIFVHHHFEPISEFWDAIHHLFHALDAQHFDWVMILHGITIKFESVPKWNRRMSSMRDVHGYHVATTWRRTNPYGGHDNEVEVLITNTEHQTVQASWIMNCRNCESCNDV